MGLIKYRSEMVSPLHQGSLSLLLSGSGCEGEQGERSNGTEKYNGREGEQGKNCFLCYDQQKKQEIEGEWAGEWEGRRTRR